MDRLPQDVFTASLKTYYHSLWTYSGEGQAMAALLRRLRLTEDMDRFNKG